MARYSAVTPGVAVAAGVTRTALQVLAGAQERALLRELAVSTERFDAVLPLLVNLYRQTSAGTMTGLTPKADDPADGTPDATASHTATVEPTNAGDLLRSWWVPSTQGLFIQQFPLGAEIVVPKAGRIGLQITNFGTSTVNPVCSLVWEETALYSTTVTSGTISATNRTLIQLLAGAQDRMKIVEVGIGFNGSLAVPPISVWLARETTAGSGGTAFTPKLIDPADGTPAASALTNITTEPTQGDVIAGPWQVPANNGNQLYQLPLGREIVVPKGERIGLRYHILAASGTPTVTAYVIHEE